MVYGQDPEIGTSSCQEVWNDSVKEFVEIMSKMHEEAKSLLIQANDNMKRFYNKWTRPEREYKVGDKVWLETLNIQMDKLTKKLDDKHYGPFEIQKKVRKVTYQLKLPLTWKNIHPVFNECLLSLFIGAQFFSTSSSYPATNWHRRNARTQNQFYYRFQGMSRKSWVSSSLERFSLGEMQMVTSMRIKKHLGIDQTVSPFSSKCNS